VFLSGTGPSGSGPDSEDLLRTLPGVPAGSAPKFMCWNQADAAPDQKQKGTAPEPEDFHPDQPEPQFFSSVQPVAGAHDMSFGVFRMRD
ncbi:hypothetical protein, partial [Gluconobacter oxydans]|uniref:hypothetical protein n=1 Tax=Gluconobacter oxydans TaxID=442 RepID=UPI0039E758FF